MPPSFFRARTISTYLLALTAFFAANTLSHAEDPIPKGLPASRFDKLATHSPFAPPTEVVRPTATPEPLKVKELDKYTLALLMRDGDGYIATLNNKETSQHTRATTLKENDEGIAVASVEWSPVPSQTKVTLRKGQDFAVVSFDENGTGTAAAPNPIPPQRANMRPVPPNPGGFRPPPGVAPMPGQQPGNASAVRRGAVIRAPGPNRPLPRPGQPGVNFTNAPRPQIPGARPLASKPNDDDDDDDDN